MSRHRVFVPASAEARAAVLERIKAAIAATKANGGEPPAVNTAPVAGAAPEIFAAIERAGVESFGIGVWPTGDDPAPPASYIVFSFDRAADSGRFRLALPPAYRGVLKVGER